MQTKEEKKEYQRRWITENREKRNATARAWVAKNREKAREADRRAYQKLKLTDPERLRRKGREWYQKHKVRVCRDHKEHYRILVGALKSEVLNHYGPVCACCGFSDVRFLSIDHVKHGKGNRSPSQDRRAIQFLRRIIFAGFPEDYQILCMNCNWAKGVWGKCFHESVRE